jgi:serine/threonine-protein kinase
MSARALCVAVAALSLLATRAGRAEPSQQERALASRLFDDASKLMASGASAAACPKYAESARLDRQLGTLLHLGECYAGLGKTASAWATFKQAADLAAQGRDARAPKIRERLAELEHHLSNLLLVVAQNEPADLEIRNDQALIGRAGWATPIPVDPGDHEIVATARGTKPRRLLVRVADGATLRVELPPLQRIAEAPAGSSTAAVPRPTAAPASAPPEGPDLRPWHAKHRQLLAVIVGGVGVTGLGVGSAFGLMAKPTYEKSARYCNGDHCDPAGHDYRERALGQARVADIAFGVGAAALAGAAVLWLTAPRETARDTASRRSASLLPLFGPGAVALSLEQAW